MIEIGDVVGSYRITGLLGVGGMGSVLRGVHVADGSEAAIKTVSAPRESLLPAIRREIVALGKLRHPGIVRILESGSVDGVPWYAMELHDPRSLVDLRDALWSTDAAPDLRPAWTAVRRLCEALAYLHGEGMVHGDIKPSNVLWGPEGRTVLIDFGLLTAFGEQGRDAIDARAHAAGSLVYMAPEQIDGEPIDARADLYAVGCVLYELVTGRPPFEHTRVDDLLDAHRHATPTPPSARGLPRALDDLILRLLAKRPRDRIGHAVDVAARLVELGAEASGVRGPRPRPYLYRPGLAGRQRRVDELSACVDACFVAGRPGLAFVVGESGVGKTRLIAEVARAAQVRGARVLSGVCAATGVGGLQGLARPLLAIADRCRAEGAEETRRLVGGRGKLLARYQPALAGLPGQGSEPEPSELPFEAARALVSHELCVTFEALAADRPLLLIVDDLQWADELTLAFLQALRERATATHARVFVIGAARSDEIGAGLGSLVADDPTRRFDLDRIDEDGVRTMVGDMLASAPSDALVRFVARETEGNPFFVAEYLRAAVVEGLITRDDRGRFRLVGDDEASLSSLSLPRSLRALVARRMAGIGDDARRVLDVSAVLGRDLEPELVIEVAGIDDAAYGRAIGALLDRQILEDAGEGLRFSHDKVREVAAESVGDEVRASIHRSAARAYEARVDASPGAAGAAAHHWFAAGDEAKAAPLLLLAARRSLVECDNERTQSGYRRALSILEGAPSDAVTRALLEWRGRWEDAEDPGVSAGTDEAAALREARRVAHRGLGDTYATIGRYDDAIAEYEAAMTVSDGEVARADALARIGGANFAKGELLIAAQHLGEALACLGERVPETRLDALRSIVRSSGLLVARLVQRRPLEAARARAVERLRVRILNRLTYINYSFSIERAAATHLAALAAAERIATTSEAAETFAHHGPLFAGHWASSARYHALRAIEVCRGEGHLAMLMTAEFMAGMCFAFQAEWEAAAEHFRAAIDLYPRVGDANVLQTAHENLAYVLLYRGDHGGALAEASRSLALAERTGDVRGTVNSACHVALANLRLGDLEQARRVADQALVALASLEDPVVHCILYTVRGRIERAAGDLEAARVALDRAVSIAEEHHLVQEEVVPAYTELVEVDTQLPGRSSEAARLLARASSIGRRFPAHRGPLLRAEALLLAREGRTRAAFRCLTRAARIHREQGMRHELGCTLTVLTALARGDL